MKLLLVEDNAALAHWLARLLRQERFTVDAVGDGEAAERLLLTEHYDLILLDLMLPRLTGHSLLRRLRDKRNDVPVIVVTASASIDDKVEVLGTGADDYLVKPFETRELVARIKALIRRQVPGKTARIECADLSLDLDTRQFAIGGEPLAMPPREHAVLEILMLKLNKTVPKKTLVDSVFGLDDDASEDAIEIYVHRLRKKLAPCGASIVTLRGLGYLLRARDDS
ncbi:MAG: response regulator [Burkholderiales bacterium]